MYPWTKQMMDLWYKSVSGMYSASGPFSGTSSRGAEQYSQSGAENPWEMPFKMAQTMCESFYGLWGAKKDSSIPKSPYSDLMLNMMQMGLEEYVDLQQKWMQEVAESSALAGSGQHEDLMKLTSIWLEASQKLLRPFLNVPTVGLTRSYQEQVNQVVDKYYAFSAALTELLHHLNIPMSEATRVVREQMEEMNKEGAASVDSKELYDKWVATLESNYMDMFRSPDYLLLLSKTVDAYGDFLASQQQVYGNSLRNLPVATTKDLDELAKEIYMLKKRLREFSRRMEAQCPSGPDNGNGHPYNVQQ